jgi:hydroxymethylbilane synthase
MNPSSDGSTSLILATRGSRLALRQSEIVAEMLRAAHPGLTIDIQVVKTKGDVDQRPFAQIGGKGLFTSEVERELVEDRADIAVHSAKDLTAEIAAGCVIAAIPDRASAHDVVVGGSGSSGEERIANLDPGAKVGTSSMRRRSLLAEMRPDLEPVELRGNLDTRLRKVAEGVVNAAILAAAGIERLGNADADTAPLYPDSWVPAPAQGALAVEARNELWIVELVAAIDDARARAEVELERAFAARLEGGCSVPLGCRAVCDGSSLVATGYLGAPEGTFSIRDRISGGMHEAVALGTELADAILQGGGDEILADIKETTTPEVSEP